MSSKIAALLAERAVAEAEAARLKEAERAQHLTAMREVAKQTLDTFLGEFAGELLPLIYSQGEDRNRNGLLINWWLGSDEMEDVDRFPIEGIFVLETPEDIVNGANPVAKVTMINYDGTVVEEFAIATFLDSMPIEYSLRPDVCQESMPHHRTYWAGGFVVNVPPFVLEEPAPAPVAPPPPTCDEDGDLW